MADAPGATPRVACVVVNWNGQRDTAACLETLRVEGYPALDVIVVDNGSTDGSLEALPVAHPWVQFVAAGANLGFPRGCNLGAAQAVAQGAAFVWLLNNDTLVPPGTLRLLVEAAAARPDAGLVGSVLFYAEAPARVQAWGGGRVSLWSGYNRHFRAPVMFAPRSRGHADYLTFASVLIRQECFEELGGLYEGAFMYFEDADFCVRAERAGWGLTVAAETAILHREGASASPRSPAVVRLVTAAGLHFLARHAPVPAVACLLYGLSRLGKRLLKFDGTGAKAVLGGVRDAWAARPMG